MLKLDDKNREITNAYIHNYGGAIMRISLDQFLRPWSKNKQLLYRLLGNQLSYTWELDESGTKASAINEIENTITARNYASPFSNLDDALDGICRKHGSHAHGPYYFIKRKSFNVSAEEIYNNRLEKDYEVEVGDKTFEFKSGERVVKNFQKICQYIAKNYIEDAAESDFGPERMAKDIDRITKAIELGKKKKSVTLSIYPMDYLTMSDNEEKWNSCMNLRNRGCYCNGAYEMMTSPNVIVAYTKSSKNKMTIRKGEMWNSKTWRQLFIVDRRFILAGKPYPKQSDGLTSAIMSKLVELASQNLQWNDFDDINHIYTWYDDSHKLKVITHDMYNDYQANDTLKFPIRYSAHYDNKKRIIVNYSGPIYCLSCGRKINANTKIGENDYICYDCSAGKYEEPEICPICNRNVRTNSGVRYLDNDLDFKTPLHNCCYEEGIGISILNNAQYIVSPDTACMIFFKRDRLWKDIEYYINKEDLQYLMKLPQWHEFVETGLQISYQDRSNRRYQSYSYTGLIEDYNTFKRFMENTILGAA